MNNIKRAIRLIRKNGTHISKRVAQYILEEFEDDLFPYSYGDGSLESIIKNILDLVAGINSGKINLSGSYEDRLLSRYVQLKEVHLDLLTELNKSHCKTEWLDLSDDLPF